MVFSGDAMPLYKEVAAEMKAFGLTAKPDKALKVFRVQDIAQTAGTFARSSPPYGWTSAFRVSLEIGAPIDDPRLAAGIDVPDYIRKYRPGIA